MYTLRPVTMHDALELLQWKNDSVTRANAIVTSGIIYWSDHLAWLEKRLAKPGFYLICEGDAKCGWIRFDIADEIEVAIVLDPKYRGKKVASQILGVACSLVQDRYRKPLFAKIVDGNTASYTVFVKAGFKPDGHRTEYDKGYTILRRA